MPKVAPKTKGHSRNPLKSSAPLGAALAFLGVDGAVPLLHGSHGCSTFAFRLLMRHMDENLFVHSSALTEVTSVLGSMESLEQSLITVHQSVKPKLIGVASTALVETTGEDWMEQLKVIARKRAREFGDTILVGASTPDFEGAIEEGWSTAVTALIDALVDGPRPRVSGCINVLTGVHQTPAELDELRGYCELFGLSAYIAPDLRTDYGPRSRQQHENTRAGGAPITDIVRMAEAVYTLAIGEHMREPAELLAKRAGVPFSVLPTWTGLEASDKLVGLLSQLSGVAAPASLRRQRELLLDAYLTSCYVFSDKRVAIASDPDLLFALTQLVHGLGARVVSAVSSTSRPRVLKQLSAERVSIADLGEWEEQAGSARAQLLLTHSHGRDASHRLGVPLYRVGFPIVDRLGVQDRCWLGYAGTRRLVFDLANLLQPRSWTEDMEDELFPITHTPDSV